MRATFIFLVILCVSLMGCDKTSDELKSEKAAEKQNSKNAAAHERNQ